MRLFGSLNNRFAEHSRSIPVAGEGATLYAYTDRYAGTVTKVSPSGKTAWITEDTVSWQPHPSGYATGYAPNPNGRTWRASKRKNGTWKTTGRGSGGLGVTFGTRSAYRDPHF